MSLKLPTKQLQLVSQSFLLFLAATVPVQAQMVGDEALSPSHFTIHSCSQARENFLSRLSAYSLAEELASFNTNSESENTQKLNSTSNLDREQNTRSDRLASATMECNCITIGLPGRWVWAGGRYICFICPVPY
jgi:hypothetical protein